MVGFSRIHLGDQARTLTSHRSADEDQPSSLSCPHCYTATQYLHLPCPLRLPTCTGPSSPAVACTSTYHVFSTPSLPDNAACPTLTSFYPCPTQTPCNERACLVKTVVHRDQPDTSPCPACPATPKALRTEDRCPKVKCHVAPTPCGEGGEQITTTATTTLTSGCDTVVVTALEPCPGCGGCTRQEPQCPAGSLATATRPFCRPRACPAVRRKCDESDDAAAAAAADAAFAPSGTVTSVHTRDCTVVSVTGSSPCAPCPTCQRDWTTTTTTGPPAPTRSCSVGEGTYYSNLCTPTGVYPCGVQDRPCEEEKRSTLAMVRSTQVVDGCKTVVHTGWVPCPGCDGCWVAGAVATEPTPTLVERVVTGGS
jgi:hypothetical protein